MSESNRDRTETPDWDNIRRQFPGSRRHTNFAGMAMASVPYRVRRAIARGRTALDEAPWLNLNKCVHDQESKVCAAAHEFCDVPIDGVALTTGTTLGLALLYGGLRLLPGQEILTTQHEFQGAQRILDLRRQRDGTIVRHVCLYDRPATVTEEGLIDSVMGGLTSRTRVLALTWVYSNTGIKLPIARIAALLAEENQSRSPAERVLLCLDGVHGFGVENASFKKLGCDFMVSGCHKWICGPRGTGVWLGKPESWTEVLAMVPTSSSLGHVGLNFSPGGVQAYEHLWAVDEAFRFLSSIGSQHIETRIHELATKTKEALALLPGLTIITPMDTSLSSGIVCFDVDGRDAMEIVIGLLDKNIVATISSFDAAREDTYHARLSLSIHNSEEDIDRCAEAVGSLLR